MALWDLVESLGLPTRLMPWSTSHDALPGLTSHDCSLATADQIGPHRRDRLSVIHVTSATRLHETQSLRQSQMQLKGKNTLV